MKKQICLLFVLLSIISAKAQSIDKDTVKLNEVGVTSVRFEMKTVVSDEIRPDTIPSFSQETPYYFSRTVSVNSQSDNGTPFGYSYFTLRGMGQTRINYTMNGVPLNDGEDLATYTSNYTDLISNLRSIQIVRGAGVSSNGASSYAGLVNMDMKSPFDTSSTRVTALYGSFNTHRTNVSYNSGMINDHFGVYASVSNTGTDGFRDYSYGKSTSGFFSAGYINNKVSVRLNSVYGTTKNGQSWLAVPEGMNPRTNPLLFGNKGQSDNFTQEIYQLQSSFVTGENSTVTVSPYLVTIRGGYDFPLGENLIGNLYLDSRNVGGYASWKVTQSHFSTEVGVNCNNFQRKHDSNIFGEHYINTGYKNDFSIYGKGSYHTKSFTFNADVQYRNAKFRYEGSELSRTFFDYGFVNMHTGIRYEKSAVKPYIGFSRTTREPTRTDLFGYNDNIDLSNIDQVNNVKPETVNDIEAGISIQGRFSLDANVYIMDFRNEILSLNQLNYLGILLRKNVERSRRTGVEVNTSYSVTKEWTIGGNLNASSNRVLVDGNYKKPILTPELICYAYSLFKNKKFSFEANCKYVSSSFLEASNNMDFKVSSYCLLNAVAGYDITKKTTLTLFVNNILNTNWQTSGNANFDEITGKPMSKNYFYSCGVNGYVQLTCKF